MGRPRLYKTNAERQAAYRERKAQGQVVPAKGASVATREITRRVMKTQGQDSG